MLRSTDFCWENENKQQYTHNHILQLRFIWFDLRGCHIKCTYLSSIRHLLSRTLQYVLKLSNSSMHFGDCWHIANAWLHVGSASIGYGSFSVGQIHWHYTNCIIGLDMCMFAVEKCSVIVYYKYLFSSLDRMDDRTESLENYCILDQDRALCTDTLDGKMEMLVAFSMQPSTLSP